MFLQEHDSRSRDPLGARKNLRLCSKPVVRTLASKSTYLAPGDGSAVCRAIRNKLPDVIVIDLSYRPSHVAREVATWLRKIKATRAIPIVFAGGEESKVAAVRERSSRMPATATVPQDRGRVKARCEVRAEAGPHRASGNRYGPLPREICL